jgi:Bacterial pre-peptidase C-terminal domain
LSLLEEEKPKRKPFRWGVASTLAGIVLVGVMVAIFVRRVEPGIFNDSSGGTLNYGETVTDYIGGGERDRWTFRGARGDVVAIRMDGGFDTYVSLEDSDGRELAYNDDFNGTRSSYIAPFSLPQSGTYTIIARGWSSSGSGTYTLQLEYYDAVPTAPPTLVPTATSAPSRQGTLEYGESGRGRVNDAAGDSWTFRGDEGDIITLDMEGDFDTYLLLYDSDNRELIRDDDSGDDNNARIAYYVLPNDGTFTIVARGWAGRTGSYTLTLRYDEEIPPTATPTEAPPPTEQGSLEYGQTVEGNVRGAAGDSWTFRGERGDRVTISMEGEFDTYLLLYDSDNRELTRDDDGGSDLNAQIDEYRLPYDGTYIIIARGFGGNTGSYTLTITEGR